MSLLQDVTSAPFSPAWLLSSALRDHPSTAFWGKHYPCPCLQCQYLKVIAELNILSVKYKLRLNTLQEAKLESIFLLGLLILPDARNYFTN